MPNSTPDTGGTSLNSLDWNGILGYWNGMWCTYPAIWCIHTQKQCNGQAWA